MKAEIISVGTELLLGHTINSDAAHAARELARHGIDLLHIQTVGDNAQRLLEALDLAATRADIIITTGGLGPTDDDLTKAVVAKFAGAPLVEDSQSAAWLKEYFGARKTDDSQFRQALKPEGAVVFANPNGTAPGYAVPFGKNQHVILLPGPPRELEPMLKNEVAPFLAKLCRECIYSTSLMIFGMGEGHVAELLGALVNNNNPTVATYAGNGEVIVKITAKAAREEEARKLADPLADEIRQKLGAVVYGRDAPSLGSVLVSELVRQKKTIATAESCTGGLVAKLITDQPGASAVFHLGLVSYSNEAKEKILGVDGAIIEKHGAVSPQTARAMAMNVKNLAGASLGIGITGIAGPDGGSAEKPVGLVYIALAFGAECHIKRMWPQGRYLGREWTRMRAAAYALDLARRYLLGLELEQ